MSSALMKRGIDYEEKEKSRERVKARQRSRAWDIIRLKGHRLHTTAFYCLSYFSVGLAWSQRGPALLDLQQLTGTSVQQASTFLTAASAGIALGSLLSGLLYDTKLRNRRTAMLLFSILLMGAATALTPFCTNLWAMIMSNFTAMFGAGGVSTVINTNSVRLWHGHSKGKMVLQVIHFCVALGAVLAPFITEPFLSQYPSALLHNGSNYSTLCDFMNNSDNHSSTDNGNHHSIINNINNRSNISTNDGSSFLPMLTLTTTVPERITEQSKDPVIDTFNIVEGNMLHGCLQGDGTASQHAVQVVDTKVHFAFFISAIIIFLSAAPTLIQVVKTRGKDDDEDGRHRAEEEIKQPGDHTVKNEGAEGKNIVLGLNQSHLPHLPIIPHILMLAWACLFYCLFSSVEGVLPNYLSTYSVLQFGWGKSEGAMLTSVFWISHASSRFACIFVIRLVGCTRLLLGCFVLALAAVLAILLASLWDVDWLLWISTGVAGLSLGPGFPTGLGWIDRHLMPMTGRVASLAQLSSGLGTFASPLVLGQVIEHRGAIWLSYIMLGNSILFVLTFVFLLLFTKFIILPKYPAVVPVTEVIVDEAAKSEDSEQAQALIESPNTQ